MPAAESKKVTPLTTILPSSGVSTPAMQRSVQLLPQPEAPSSATRSSPASSCMSSVNPG